MESIPLVRSTARSPLVRRLPLPLGMPMDRKAVTHL